MHKHEYFMCFLQTFSSFFNFGLWSLFCDKNLYKNPTFFVLYGDVRNDGVFLVNCRTHVRFFISRKIFVVELLKMFKLIFSTELKEP